MNSLNEKNSKQRKTNSGIVLNTSIFKSKLLNETKYYISEDLPYHISFFPKLQI